jgi:hypothetical protein
MSRKVHLGFATLRETQDLNGVGDGDAVELGVRAVHEARRATQ